MESGSEIHDDSESQLFQLFPEIWEDIIIPMVTPTDFQSLINSNPKRREMFREIIAGRLLPMVLEILSKHWTFCKQSLVAWRGVNRGGKLTIDGILEEALSPKKYFDDACTDHYEWWSQVMDENQPLRKAIQRFKRCHDFGSPLKVQEFMRFMKFSGAQPKYVALSFKHFPWENHLNSIPFEFLSQFGSSLSSVDFRLENASWNLLLTLLSHLGNVKVLKLWGSMDLSTSQTPPQRVETYQKFQLSCLELLDIEELEEKNGFPYAPETEGVVAVILSHCGPQLTRLICADGLFENPKNMDAIRSVRIRYLKLNGIYEELLSRFNPQMEEFHLESDLLGLAMDIIPTLNSFSPTLTHFQLAVPLGGHDNHWFIAYPLIVYPKLTHFSAYIYHSNLSWFWPFIQKKMINLAQLNLHEAGYSGPILSVEKLSRGFGICDRLQKITVYWRNGNSSPFQRDGNNPMPGRMEIYRDGTVKNHIYKELPLTALHD